MSTTAKRTMLRSVEAHTAKVKHARLGLRRAVYGASVEGASLREIAERCSMSPSTVRRIIAQERAARLRRGVQ